MIKRIMAIVAVLSMLILMLSSMTAFCEEGEEFVPKLTFKLNADGTTYMTFVQAIDEESADEEISGAKQSLGARGFDVEKGENPTSIVITKTYTVEEGYIIDFSLFGSGESGFVNFDDLFVNRYGIKNNFFNSENSPEGQTYFSVTIETPVRATYSNATTRDNTGKINTWQIVSASKNEINLTFKRYNVIPLISTIFGLAILLVLIYLVISSNRKNKANQLESSAIVIDSDETLNIEGEQDVEDMENPVEEIEFDAVEDETTKEDDE